MTIDDPDVATTLTFTGGATINGQVILAGDENLVFNPALNSTCAITTTGSGTITNGTTASVGTQMGGAIQGGTTSFCGIVTTYAGSAAASGSTDGTGTAARFLAPQGITTDGTNLYVTDTSNHTIRQIVISTGVVITLAGSAGTSGTTDGTGTAARFSSPVEITTDGTNLYVADTSNHTIRQIVISTGMVTTLAGSAGTSGTTDGTGTAAKFNLPHGITTDGTHLYVVDQNNSTIRKIQ